MTPVDGQRTALGAHERRTVRGRLAVAATHTILVVTLVVAGLGPLLWLAKSAITPAADTLADPMGLWPHGITWEPLRAAWDDIDVKKYFLNTVWVAAGSWVVQMIVATTGGYFLGVLRPRWAKIVEVAVLSTLFVPGIVLLIPLYLTVIDVPVVHISLLNSFWAVWLPAGASAFNLLLVSRFFAGLPAEVLDAARVDGAGNVRLFVSIVLPMSKPILGVASVFAVIAAWKDFLWPFLVLPEIDMQPLSVRLPSLQASTQLDVFLAALALSTLVPVAMFLVFQRWFLSGQGLSGALKG